MCRTSFRLNQRLTVASLEGLVVSPGTLEAMDSVARLERSKYIARAHRSSISAPWKPDSAVKHNQNAHGRIKRRYVSFYRAR